jgi:hypothetical protein
MMNYNTYKMIEEDTDKYTNYELVQYEFPFPELAVERMRQQEMMRFQMKKPIIAIASNINNCQKGD